MIKFNKRVKIILYLKHLNLIVFVKLYYLLVRLHNDNYHNNPTLQKRTRLLTSPVATGRARDGPGCGMSTRARCGTYTTPTTQTLYAIYWTRWATNAAKSSSPTTIPYTTNRRTWTRNSGPGFFTNTASKATQCSSAWVTLY